jgi:osmotically-inducible protein OsmY
MLDDIRSSGEVQTSVVAELDWDPMVDSRDITVTAGGGAVTLRGTVGSLRQVREAQHAARRVHGVISVWNHLTVRPRISGHAEDCQVHTAVLHALMLKSAVPVTVEAKVESGVVRLTGTVTWHWQRNEAERACATVAGVLGITNEIELIPAPPDTNIQQVVMSALRRHAPLTFHHLSVDALSAGIVILSGTVTTWAEHDEAVAAGWSARGVVRVIDRIEVCTNHRD